MLTVIALAEGSGDYIIHPIQPIGPPPSETMPRRAAESYETARLTASISARAAVILLRSCLEELLEPATSLANAIGELATRGFPQQGLHLLEFVRVIGNEAAHSGDVDINNIATLESAFAAVLTAAGWLERMTIVDAQVSQLPTHVQKKMRW
jgi:hypothetical protein